MSTTHNPNITVDIALAAAPAQSVGFGTVLLIALLSASSLDGDTVRTYTDASDAATDDTAGYISTSVYNAVVAALSQSPRPASVKVAAIDDSVAVAAVKAERAFAPLAGAFDTVIEATTAGVAGNSIQVILIGDDPATVTIEVVGATGATPVVIIHFFAGTSTITNVQNAITALAGANDIIGVKTTGTGATVLAAADAIEASLAGGADATVTETYAAALARIRAIDDDFYGVAIEERTDAAILAVTAAIEAMDKIVAVQSNDAGILTGTYPVALAALVTRENTIPVYHDVDAEWMDIAYLCARLVANPDTISASWDAAVAGVAPYTTSITAAERAFALANNWNIGLPSYGVAFFVDKGVNATGRPIYEIVTKHWFQARLLERVGALKAAHSARFAKLTVDIVGQTKVRSVLDALGAQGITAEHFLTFDSALVAITDTDRSLQRLRLTARGQIAVSGRLFQFNISFSREALT